MIIRFQATQRVEIPKGELLGDRVARWVAPVAKLIRWPVDCPGCTSRQEWLNRMHRKVQAIFGPTGGSDPK